MIILLSHAEQDRVIANSIELMLHNFSLASHVADMLIEYSAAGLPPPRATVYLLGKGRSAEIPGQNCGFFTTPVIQMAILDCRRSLEFFGLAFDSGKHAIVPIKKRRKDDLGIEHFGLPRVTLSQLTSSSIAVASSPMEQLITDIHLWSNKCLAHLTLLEPDIKLETIRDVSKVLSDAYLRLLFDGLGRPRPQIQPVNSPSP